jgi:hypothetical protein
MILDAWTEEMSATTVEQYIVTGNIFDPLTGETADGSGAWSSVGNCLVWIGSQAERVLAEKIRDQVDAVAVFLPTVTITGQKLRITNSGVSTDYEIIGKPDNIAYNNEAILVGLKELT